MIVRYKEWKGLFFCDDCGAVMTLTAYASEMLDTSARDRGWAIGKDHTELLGDSFEKIAREKCGIIKKGC